MNARRLSIVAASVAAAAAGAILIATVHSLHHRKAVAASATDAANRTRLATLSQLRAVKLADRQVRRELLTVKGPADALAKQQSAVQLRAFRAARDAAKPSAYVEGYNAAFPVANDQGDGWYIVHATDSGRYHTTSWYADNPGQEYVVAGGGVTAYTRGSAPDPYLVGTGDGTYGGSYNVGPGDVPGYYNSQGNWVPSPSPDPNLSPAGPTALCADGTYSYSQSASGTCSWHGGVAQWNP